VERRTVEEVGAILDVGELGRRGALAFGANGTLAFGDGPTVDFQTDRDHLHLGGQVINIASVACGCFGVRACWRCPGCQQRARRLYLPPGETQFLCRACHGLAYASQHEGPGDRAVRKAGKALDRLGPPDGSVRDMGRRLRAMRPIFQAILAELGGIEQGGR